MATITIELTSNDILKNINTQRALQTIASNFNADNLTYIAELANKQGVNEKFTKLKNNSFVKGLL
jgi:hypothetical protein